MKIRMDESGTLTIESQNDLEAGALQLWYRVNQGGVLDGNDVDRSIEIEIDPDGAGDST